MQRVIRWLLTALLLYICGTKSIGQVQADPRFTPLSGLQAMDLLVSYDLHGIDGKSAKEMEDELRPRVELPIRMAGITIGDASVPAYGLLSVLLSKERGGSHVVYQVMFETGEDVVLASDTKHVFRLARTYELPPRWGFCNEADSDNVVRREVQNLMEEFAADVRNAQELPKHALRPVKPGRESVSASSALKGLVAVVPELVATDSTGTFHLSPDEEGQKARLREGGIRTETPESQNANKARTGVLWCRLNVGAGWTSAWVERESCEYVEPAYLARDQTIIVGARFWQRATEVGYAGGYRVTDSITNMYDGITAFLNDYLKANGK